MDIKCIKLKKGHDSKLPLESWSRPENRYSYDEVKDWPGLGIIPPKGYLVLDIDDKEVVKILDNVLIASNSETLTLTTKKGKHYWFKSDIECGSVNKSTPLTIKADFRYWRSNLIIKINNKNRVWNQEIVNIGGVNMINDNMIAKLPDFLVPVSKKLKEAQGLGEGEGRNQFFVSHYLHPMYEMGFKDKDMLKECLQLINNYVFLAPIEEYELDALLVNDSYRENVKVKKSSKVAHGDNINNNYDNNVKAAIDIINEFGIKSNDKTMYTKEGLVYNALYPTSSEYRNTVEKSLRQIKKLHREDVVSEIFYNSEEEQTPTTDEELVTRTSKINVLTGEVTPHGENEFIFNYIDEIYNPEAYHERTDTFYNEVFNNNKEIRNFWFEFIGYMFLQKNNSEEDAALLLVGEGGNGKSVIMETVKNLLGEKNYSALNMKKFNDEYTLSGLKDKMANFGDDETHGALKELGPLKSVISGSSINVNEKYVTPYSITPHAKLIFATNEIPQFVRDNSEGIKRRFNFIEFKFNARTKPDTKLLSKLTSKLGRQYTLRLIVEGGKRWLENGLSSVGEIERYTKEQFDAQNVVHNFIKEIWDYINVEDFIPIQTASKSLKPYTLYNMYKTWQKDNGTGQMTTTRFTNELRKLKDERFYIESNRQYCSISGFSQRHDGNKLVILNPDKTKKSRISEIINLNPF